MSRPLGLEPFPFTIEDDATPADSLIVTATSSDQAVLADASIQLGGSGSTRTLGVAPVPTSATDSTTTITVSVSDGTETTTASFTLTLVANFKYYLAEGSTGPFFDTDIVLANPIAMETAGTITFLKEDGTTVVHQWAMTGFTRLTVHVDTIPGMEATSFSAVVEQTFAPPGVEIIVERTMTWDATGYGSHTEKASQGAAREWYFAEGSQGFFSTFFLLVNPQTTANTAHVTYLREGLPPIEREYPLLPLSRLTVVAGEDDDLVNSSFGARVEFDQPGMAERAMYFGASPTFTGGHDSAGVTKPATEWLLAEGATGSFFNTFVLIANPGAQPAEVTLTYLPATGVPVVKEVTIPAGQRVTRNIETEDATLASAAVGVVVESDQPVVVERSMYWPVPTWYEAHNSFGLTEAGQRWGLAEGRVGGENGQQTYILLANPNPEAAEVEITFLQLERPLTNIVKSFTLQPTSRLNVAITGAGSDVPELEDEEFGASIVASLPIVVERSFYANATGDIWQAGTNATAARLITNRPTAGVGPDQTNVTVGTTVTLQGTGGGTDDYHWTLLSRPAGSNATLSGATTPNPTFTVDIAGEYVAQLIVGAVIRSEPKTVRVSTTP